MKYLVIIIASVVMVGCSTVPLEPKNISDNAKAFSLPPAGKSGIYVYRDSMFGAALKKDIWIDNKCLGESAPKVFFYKDVKGNTTHIISTESEFSPNKLVINTKAGKNYFIRQYIKMGVFSGGADLEQINEDEAKKAISNLDMAKQGTCAKKTAN
jgi:hypothetical protein